MKWSRFRPLPLLKMTQVVDWQQPGLGQIEQPFFRFFDMSQLYWELRFSDM